MNQDSYPTYLFTYKINIGCRYRITPERYSERLDVDDDLDVVSPYFRPLSNEATDLRMGVAVFCKAFPWHFVVDRQLELVQLGVGFMRIFGHHLNTLGKEISNYFAFTRPRGVTLTFHEILKRANTPFVLSLQKPQSADKFQAEVRVYYITSPLFLMCPVPSATPQANIPLAICISF